MSSDDSQSFTMDPDFHRDRKMYAATKGCRTPATTGTFHMEKTNIHSPGLFYILMSRMVKHCGSDATKPRNNLSDSASIPTDGTDVRWMADGVRETVCDGNGS